MQHRGYLRYKLNIIEQAIWKTVAVTPKISLGKHAGFSFRAYNGKGYFKYLRNALYLSSFKPIYLSYYAV